MKDAIILLAKRALPLMNPTHRAEAATLISHFEQRSANAGEEDELTAFYHRAALAWEHDMMPVRDALVTALHTGDLDALRELRGRLPQLLDQVNADPALAGALSRQLLRVFAASLDEQPGMQTANATASVEQWRGRQIFPTEFGSADLRGFSSELHLRSIFSARTTNADYLDEVAKTVDKMLSGEINQATGRLMLMKKLKQLGYDPEKGFPQDMADVPPAEKGSLRDLSSRQRLDLMLRTNVQVTRNVGRVMEGNTALARRAWPAWELKRVASRVHPRGEEKHTIGWEQRWKDAGESVGWEGALKDVMMALKDSPIWQALGDGAGGYTDTLGHPFGPFAFNSGYDIVAVARDRWEKVSTPGMKDEVPKPTPVTLAPTEKEATALIDRLSPDIAARLRERWAA